jgi:hypothetical protein
LELLEKIECFLYAAPIGSPPCAEPPFICE